MIEMLIKLHGAVAKLEEVVTHYNKYLMSYQLSILRECIEMIDHIIKEQEE